MRWFYHRRRTGGRHNCITYLLTDVVAWTTATPATPPSICWFLSSDSANRHILGGGDPKLELGRDLCTMHLIAKFHRCTLNRLEVIMLTNKLANKQTPLTTSTSLRYATPVGNNYTRYIKVLRYCVIQGLYGCSKCCRGDVVVEAKKVWKVKKVNRCVNLPVFGWCR